MVDMERVIVLLLDCRFLVSVIRCNAETAFVYILIGYSTCSTGSSFIQGNEFLSR